MKNSMQIFTDGGSRGNPGPSAGAFVVYKDGKLFETGAIYLGVGTNNQAEYEAVVMAMHWVKTNIDNEDVAFFLDSELVVRQLNGLYKIKDNKLKKLADKINEVKNSLTSKISFISVPRSKNKKADRLVNECLDRNMGVRISRTAGRSTA